MAPQKDHRSTAPREIHADLQLLLECLNCQMYEPVAVKQSLLGIGSLCTSTPVAKDMLRDDGGLQFVFRLLTETGDVEVQEAAMYALGCAVENNVYSQKQLTTGAVFGFLRTILREPQLTPRVQRTACFLLLSLVTNNSQGQTMIRSSGCLDVLLNMFKKCLPEEGVTTTRVNDDNQTWFEDLTAGRSLEVWAAATSTICGCLNNPQNDENQRLCAAIFPQAFVFLQEQTAVGVIRPIMSLIGLATANNYHNQVRVQTAGGVRVLMSALHRAVNRLSDPDHQLLAVSIASTIDTFIADNKKIAEECGQLGLAVLLLQLLRCSGLTADTLLPLVISLGHLLEASVVHQRQLVEAGGLNVLISTLTASEDAELSKAIKYVLQGCVDTAREMKSRPSEDRKTSRQTNPESKCPVPDNTMETMILQKLAALERRLSDDHQGEGPPGMGPPSGGFREMLSPDRGSFREVSVPGGRNRATAGEWWTTYTMPPVPGTHAQTTSRHQQVAARLETELEKERSLRRSLEAKASSMEQELKERQRADRTAALTSELVKQTNITSKKKARPVPKKPVRRAESRARLGGSQHITTDSSESSPNLTMSPSKPSITHTTPTPQHVPKAKQGTRQVGPGQEWTKAKKGKVVKDKEQCELTKPKQGNSQERVKKQIGQSVGVGDTESVSIGLQTEDLPDQPHFSSDQITSPQHNRPANHLTCHSVGVQTPSFGQGPVTTALSKEPEAAVLKDHKGSVSKGLQYDEEIEGQLKSPGLNEPIEVENPQSDHDDLVTSCIESAKQGKMCSSEIQQQTPKACSVVLRPLSRELMPPTELPRKTVFTSPLNRPIRTPRPIHRPSHQVHTPIRRSLPSHSLPSPSQGSMYHYQSYPQPSRSAPPSPCPSEFDCQLLRAANTKTRLTRHTPLSAYSPRGSIALSSGPGQTRPGTPITLNRRYNRNHSTPIMVRSTRPPGTPVNVALRRPQPTYGRTSTSTRSLSMILTENHRDREERLPDEGGDGPSDTSGDEGSVKTGSIYSHRSTSSSFSNLSDNLVRQQAGNTKCPACQPPDSMNGPLLNSRTFNFALETSGYTCRLHRLVRAAERDLLAGRDSPRRPRKRLLRDLNKDPSINDQSKGDKVYDFTSSDSEEPNPRSLSPPAPESGAPVIAPRQFYKRRSSSSGERRRRVEYSAQEVDTLVKAVRRQGRAWASILSQNTFHPSRTAIDLKDKYKQLMKSQSGSRAGGGGKKARQPFSMAEERRLRRGVKQFGYNWKVIFDAFRFAPGRRPQELRHKWKSMHRVK